MRTPATRALALLAVLLPGLAAGQALPSETPLDVWGPDGPVRAVARDGDTLYVGGAFTYVGPPTGPFAIVDASTGTVAELPQQVGYAVAIADVPGGGWIVADLERVSRLDAAGRRLAVFDVPVEATFLAVQGNTVFLGGSFTNVRGVPRGGLAAVDLTTGALLPWNPSGSLQVQDGVLHQGVLYVLDQELTAPPPPEQPSLFNRVVAFDAATAAARPFSTGAIADVWAIAAAGSTVFVTGVTSASIAAGARVAVATGVAAPWNLTLRATHIVATATQVFAAGVTSSGPLAFGVFAVDPVSGASGSPLFTGDVQQLGLAADRLLVSRTVLRAGLPRAEMLAVSTSAPTTPLWTLDADGAVSRFSANGASIATIGGFTSIGGVTRNGVFALDLRTRRVTPFAPFTAATVPSNVSSLAVVGSLLLVGGNVLENSSALVAVDRASGAVLPWAPVPNGIVDALAIDGSQLVVGGSFPQVAGVPRRNLAAISLATGLATPWRPDPDVFVSTVTATSGYVLPGGAFTTMSGVARPAVAAFAGSALLPWSPAIVGHVRSIGVAGARVAVAGDLEDATGNTVQDFRVFDAMGQRVTYPLPAQFTSVLTVNGQGSQFLLGGAPAANGRHPLGAFDAATRADLGWAPRVDAFFIPGFVSHVSRFDDLVVAAGGFSRVSGRPSNGLAVFPTAGPPRGLRASILGGALTLTWAAPTGLPPDGYVVEAFSGSTSLGSFPVAGPTLSVAVPAGSFEVRVRATRGGGTGSASSRVAVVAPAPATAPAAPTDLVATVVGRVLRLSWALGGGNAESYVLEAGTSSGAANIATLDTGTLDTDFVAPVPPGTYFLRVRARNTFGTSAPSNEVTFVVP